MARRHRGQCNMLLVPGTSRSTSGHSGNLLSPSNRGISYPPPSPTRATLRRGFAFSQSIKNPPLVKTRNVQSQSFNWPQHAAATAQLQQSSSFNQYTTPVSAMTTTHMVGQAQQSSTTSTTPTVIKQLGRSSGQSTPKISRSSSSNETNDT
uniref:CSON009184 protein n=1 Tax=Culicoides sonorensis TaxID=179676 RepID=A0A336M3I7_CULSO